MGMIEPYFVYTTLQHNTQEPAALVTDIEDDADKIFCSRRAVDVKHLAGNAVVTNQWRQMLSVSTVIIL